MKSLKSDQKWAYGPLSRLASLARAMGYLVSATLHIFLLKGDRKTDFLLKG
jgi:hypothetical protein